jgi:hypothetical protein
MLMLLAAAQVHRAVVAILDMQPDGIFVKLPAGAQVHHVQYDVAASDDIERRIEGMLRDGHDVSLVSSSFRDGPKDQTRNLEIPGSRLRRAPE